MVPVDFSAAPARRLSIAVRGVAEVIGVANSGPSLPHDALVAVDEVLLAVVVRGAGAEGDGARDETRDEAKDPRSHAARFCRR